MKFKQWMEKRRIIEFIILFPFFSLTYWLIELLLHWHLGDSGTHWPAALFWGASMSAVVAYNSSLRRRHQNDRL